MTAETLTDDTWPLFIAQRDSVLVLTRDSCENCDPFVETLAKNDFPVAKIVLDSPGNVGFKTSFPQISTEASVLPFSILFSRGEWLDSVMGARVGAVLEWFK